MSSSRGVARELSDLRIEVSVVVGHFEMSFDDLVDLVPGNVFEFAFGAEEAVELFVGEEKIGAAKFVKDEDQLFLQIESVAA